MASFATSIPSDETIINNDQMEGRNDQQREVSSAESSPRFYSVSEWRAKLEHELYVHVLPFWTTHSHDTQFGGFFSCLDEIGDVYDHRKFIWLNGRQIFMYARICDRWSQEELETLSNGKLNRAHMIEVALKAARFSVANAIREDGLVYFSLAQDGEPYHFERKIFAACFLCLGCGMLAKVVDDAELRDVTRQLFVKIIELSHDPSALGRAICRGCPVSSPLNVPMIILNLIEELRPTGTFSVAQLASLPAIEKACADEIVKHVIVDQRIVLENVGVDGKLIPGYDGRHMNPGHAIEAGWFLFQYALRTQDVALQEMAINMVEWSFERGWDKEHGGIYYFLDSEDRSPVYLEWNMKLWWPHCEAMVAYAMLFRHTRDQKFLDRFDMVARYTLKNFSDSNGAGEWFGYLDRQALPTHRFKGGPYKGCFHVPRALFLVSELLRQVE